ncbi:hypothetical protein GCM10009841_00850 [Microlunatus panaciterrae]|uniref:Threonine dehydrogenase-like Zn-dependent dehydrogenase n=1 Tax=Microlunatus panaciterrae TaxID=400768 RepID=A0ABS2RKR8_9ACTN|nr:threonine dehydrogenase-like Zn-dependent dehydrogenase [Microlunatus panaciterrae]
MSRHETRQKLAIEFGATDIVSARGDEGVAEIMQLSTGIGADAVCEAVGSGESMTQAVRAVRPGGRVEVGVVPHDVDLPLKQMVFRNVGIQGGPASVPQYLPELLDKLLERRIEPGKVFDLELPLEEIADGYAAMDERRAIKALLWP